MAGRATATHRMAAAAAAVAVVIDVAAAIHMPLVQLAAPEVAPLLAFPEEEGALVGDEDEADCSRTAGTYERAAGEGAALLVEAGAHLAEAGAEEEEAGER